MRERIFLIGQALPNLFGAFDNGQLNITGEGADHLLIVYRQSEPFSCFGCAGTDYRERKVYFSPKDKYDLREGFKGPNSEGFGGVGRKPVR
jgi:hypothetical protein